MKQVLLLTLLVIVGLLLLSLGARLFKKQRAVTIYYASWASLYMLSVFYFTLFCRSYREIVYIQLVPLHTYKIALSCWLGLKTYSKTVCYSVLRSSRNIFQVTKNSPIEDSFLNITLFLPFGFLAGYLFKKAPLWKILLWALLISTIVEILQGVFHLGLCDVDDVLNNTLGTFLGWLLYKISNHLFSKI